MNNIIYPQLCLHAGGRKASIEEIEGVRTPDPTPTWYPISHASVVGSMRQTMEACGYRIMSEQHALAGVEGQRYFGIFALSVDGKKSSRPYDMIVGLRNSHDKTFPVAVSAGSRVFVCDNLSFSGTVKLNRRHTRHAEAEMPVLMHKAMRKLGGEWDLQDKRYEVMQCKNVSDREAHDLIARAAMARVVPDTKVMQVIRQWHEPDHEEFNGRNAWSLFNAFTHVLKTASLDNLVPRTERLTGFLDEHCGLLAMQA